MKNTNNIKILTDSMDTILNSINNNLNQSSDLPKINDSESDKQMKKWIN